MLNLIKSAKVKYTYKIGRMVRKIWRNKLEQRKLKNTNFTIFSQNCVGGILYHDLGQRFMSPTVNVLFTPSDFIKFMKNINEYLQTPLQFVDKASCSPIGYLNDVRIDFVHYKTKEEAEEKWEERKKRINWDNVFVICCDEGLSIDEIKEFDALPFENKIIFLSKEMPEIKSGVYAYHFKEKTNSQVLNFKNIIGRRYYQDYVNFIRWFNREENWRVK